MSIDEIESYLEERWESVMMLPNNEITVRRVSEEDRDKYPKPISRIVGGIVLEDPKPKSHGNRSFEKLDVESALSRGSPIVQRIARRVKERGACDHKALWEGDEHWGDWSGDHLVAHTDE